MSTSSVRSQQIRNFIKELFILRRERLMRDTCITRTQITCRVAFIERGRISKGRCGRDVSQASSDL